MKHFSYAEAPASPVNDYGSTGTTIRVLIDKETAPNFIMRRFEIEPGGHIGVHSHPAEHEIFVLQGELLLVGGDGTKTLVRDGEFVFVPPNEPHGYENMSVKPAAFICVIPK